MGWHEALKAAHHKLAHQSHKRRYKGLWEAFERTDYQEGCIVDRYSSKCFQVGDKCGSRGFSREGDCYNREHSWPKSWWGRTAQQKQNKDQHSDLHHIFPTDGYTNQMRSNHPLGDVQDGEAQYTSSNGCRLGRCACSEEECFEGLCFEPAAKYKGEFARAYFYMHVRYLDELQCCATHAVNFSRIRPWMLRMLLRWHVQHPPTLRERNRNSEVQKLQGNRNPFIDDPPLAHRLHDAKASNTT